MARQLLKTVYSFDELSDSAKDRARNWWRSSECEDFEPDYEDFERMANLLGIKIDQRPVKLMGGGTRYVPKIYWSGFSSQGDGASFEGRYSYVKGAAKAIRKEAPFEKELHRIADDLAGAQRAHFYRLNANVETSGIYSHSGSMRIYVYNSADEWRGIGDAADTIIQALRDFADWIYGQLETEYNYRMSDENVDESICINEYEFDENGGFAS